MSPRGHECVHDWCKLVGPLCASCQYNWAGTRDRPVSLGTGNFLWFLCQPAMARDLEVKSRRLVEIRFESQSLSLPAPCANNPLQRNVARQQLHRNPGILKPMRGKTKMRLQATAAQPSRLYEP